MGLGLGLHMIPIAMPSPLPPLLLELTVNSSFPFNFVWRIVGQRDTVNELCSVFKRAVRMVATGFDYTFMT